MRTQINGLQVCLCIVNVDVGALGVLLFMGCFWGAISKNYEGPDIDVATVALNLKAAISRPTALLVAERYEQKPLMSTTHRFHNKEMASQLVAIHMSRKFVARF